MSTKRTIRCAVYTRKSSEEGLEQEFNSLDAQREASIAYIHSQKHEGWKLVPTHYDDGGFSGGNMERPGLAALMSDIDQGRIDIIVVYKIDRLTRSLSDFAKLADRFDEHGVSFVSVTQQFNTTTSMGRLMLNVLLSFAQFEREVTGERIRDKIAASKKKGLWMGGPTPLGFEVVDNGLVINPTEAETVRTLFKLYLTLGSMKKVEWEARRLGLVNKHRIFKTGRVVGGNPMGEGALYKLLQNPVYIGCIRHKDQTYQGQHDAIIDQNTWQAVQDGIAKNRHQNRVRTNARFPSLLAGILFTETSNRMIATHSNKNGVRHRYYVEKLPNREGDELTRNPLRLPAMQIEKLVKGEVLALLRDPVALLDALGSIPTRETERTLSAAAKLAHDLSSGTAKDWVPVIQALFSRVIIHAETVELQLNRPALRQWLSVEGRKSPRGKQAGQTAENTSSNECKCSNQLSPEDTFTRTINAELKKSSSALKIIINGTEPIIADDNTTQLNNLARGYDWLTQLTTGQAPSIKAIAQAEGVTPSYVSRLVRGVWDYSLTGIFDGLDG